MVAPHLLWLTRVWGEPKPDTQGVAVAEGNHMAQPQPFVVDVQAEAPAEFHEWNERDREGPVEEATGPGKVPDTITPASSAQPAEPPRREPLQGELLNEKKQLEARPEPSLGVEEHPVATLQFQECLQQLHRHHSPRPIIYNSEEKLSAMVIGNLSHSARKAAASLLTPNPTILDTLHTLADADHVPAVSLLAEIYMYGNFLYPPDGKLSLERYTQLLRLDPTGDTYYMLGFIYSTGLFGDVPVDQALAHMYYTAGSDLGEPRCLMALAYRYHEGIGVAPNCGLATHFYSVVAQQLSAFVIQSPLGGPNLDRFSLRVSDLQGGIFGQVATESPTSVVRKFSDQGYDKLLFNQGHIDIDETEYTSDWLKGETFYQGTYFESRNYTAAHAQFHKCATNGRADLEANPRMMPVEKLFIARCASGLGHMLLRGEGVKVNYDAAREWLEFAVKAAGHPSAAVDLAFIHERGLGATVKSPSTAQKYLTTAFEAREWRAGLPLSKYHLAKGSPNQGTRLLLMAAKRGCTEAWLDLARLYERGVETRGNCDDTAYSFKMFVEGVEPVVSRMDWAFDQLARGEFYNALLGYAMAAEQGYEAAQASVGYLLYQPPSVLSTLWNPTTVDEATMALAEVYYRRLAQQGNTDLMVVVGDLYLAKGDHARAASFYQGAAAVDSSLGNWNMGYLYEHGLGVEQDFHLAKKSYDLALSLNPDLFVPVKLAVFKLRVRSWLNKWLLGGSHLDLAPVVSTRRTYGDWFRLLSSARRGNRMDVETMEKPDSFKPGEGGDAHRETEAKAESSFSKRDVEEDDLVDLYLFAFCGVALLLFLVVRYYNQQRIARGRAGAANGVGAEAGVGAGVGVEAGAGVGVEAGAGAWHFNFMVVPL